MEPNLTSKESNVDKQDPKVQAAKEFSNQELRTTIETIETTLRILQEPNGLERIEKGLLVLKREQENRENHEMYYRTVIGSIKE